MKLFEVPGEDISGMAALEVPPKELTPLSRALTADMIVNTRSRASLPGRRSLEDNPRAGFRARAFGRAVTALNAARNAEPREIVHFVGSGVLYIVEHVQDVLIITTGKHTMTLQYEEVGPADIRGYGMIGVLLDQEYLPAQPTDR